MKTQIDMPIVCDFAPRPDSDEQARGRRRVILIRDSKRGTMELRIAPPNILTSGYVVAMEKLADEKGQGV